jgi:membrane-bound serine protease (ClpP class)
VIGVHLVLASLFLALVNFNVPFSVSWESGGIPRALASVFGAVLVTFGLYLATVRFLPESRFGKRLILADVVASPALLEDKGIGLEAMVGQLGVALTDLRPEGRVQVINHKADAKLLVGFARAGAKVRVLRVEMNRLVVEEIAEGGTA